MGIVEGTCDARFAALRDIFEKSFADGEEIGAGICFYLDGETVVDLWGGHRDVAATQPWKRDTLVNVYSTTKGMTAHLRPPAGRARPARSRCTGRRSTGRSSRRAGKEDVPVRWLLSHQAGLPAVREPLPTDTLYDWDAMTAALAAQEPWWEPGTRHGYHALTFGHLVGEVIRRVSGQRSARFFRENVAGPLDADFHIGLAAEHDARIARTCTAAWSRASSRPGAPAPRSRGPTRREFLRDMTDPTTMTGAAFNNPPGRTRRASTRARGAPPRSRPPTATAPRARWRASTVRSRAAARLDGVRTARAGDRSSARDVEQAFGPDAMLGGMPMRFGLGFMLRQDLMPLSPNPSAFGHPGAGGSIGMADPDAKVGFGYVMNKMQMGLVGGPGAFAVLRKFYKLIRR